jgi:hypothetical protein
MYLVTEPFADPALIATFTTVIPHVPGPVLSQGGTFRCLLLCSALRM